jgi:hypothetical protein
VSKNVREERTLKLGHPAAASVLAPHGMAPRVATECHLSSLLLSGGPYLGPLCFPTMAICGAVAEPVPSLAGCGSMI